MMVESENQVLVVETPGGRSARKRKGRGYNFTSSKGRKFAERRKKERAVQGASTLVESGVPECIVQLETIFETECSPNDLTRIVEQACYISQSHLLNFHVWPVGI